MDPGTLGRVSFSLVPVFDRVDRAPAPGPWRTAAACADPGLDPEIREVFTTEAPTWSDADADALAVCANCPVLADCAGYARRVRGLVGIWGGRRRGRRDTGTPEPDGGTSSASGTRPGDSLRR